MLKLEKNQKKAYTNQKSVKSVQNNEKNKNITQTMEK